MLSSECFTPPYCAQCLQCSRSIAVTARVQAKRGKGGGTILSALRTVIGRALSEPSAARFEKDHSTKGARTPHPYVFAVPFAFTSHAATHTHVPITLQVGMRRAYLGNTACHAFFPLSADSPAAPCSPWSRHRPRLPPTRVPPRPPPARWAKRSSSRTAAPAGATSRVSTTSSCAAPHPRLPPHRSQRRASGRKSMAKRRREGGREEDEGRGAGGKRAITCAILGRRGPHPAHFTKTRGGRCSCPRVIYLFVFGHPCTVAAPATRHRGLGDPVWAPSICARARRHRGGPSFLARTGTGRWIGCAGGGRYRHG